MKNLAKEFKEFAIGGNLVEVGVALVMALALAAVINSLVENVLMPIVGIIFGEPSFDSLTWTINGSVILYGSFITAIVKFLAVALGACLVQEVLLLVLAPCEVRFALTCILGIARLALLDQLE